MTMALTEQAAEASIVAACRSLHLPTIRAEAATLADTAAKERITHRAYLAEVLAAEVDERDGRRRARRVVEARFPRIKRLEDFDLAAAPGINPATLAALAKGAWIDAGEPVVLLGDSGTGKSHLLIGLGIAACDTGRRVRYVTCASLVNELAEAADDRVLSKVVARYGRFDVLLVDELGYVTRRPQGRRAVVPGADRAGGAGVGGHGVEPPVQRVGPDLLRSPPGRRRRRPAHLPGPHHRDRHRQLPPAAVPGGQGPGGAGRGRQDTMNAPTPVPSARTALVLLGTCMVIRAS